MLISNAKSLRSWCIKGTNESTLVTDSSVSLITNPDQDHLKGGHHKNEYCFYSVANSPQECVAAQKPCFSYFNLTQHKFAQ